MELLNKLIREIKDSPRSQVCSVCIGETKVHNYKWHRFFSKYGEKALAEHNKFHVAEKEWINANKPVGDHAQILLLDLGLNNQEAKDFYSLYLTQSEIESCHNCENGRSLTEHGKLVAKLRSAIIDL